MTARIHPFPTLRRLAGYPGYHQGPQEQWLSDQIDRAEVQEAMRRDAALRAWGEAAVERVREEAWDLAAHRASLAARGVPVLDAEAPAPQPSRLPLWFRLAWAAWGRRG